MANTFKNNFAKNVSANSTIYTVGAGVQSTVIGMSIANLVDAPVSANVFVTSGGTDYYLVKNATVAVGGTLVPIGGDQKLVLEATDAIKVSSTGLTDVIVSVLEVS